MGLFSKRDEPDRNGPAPGSDPSSHGGPPDAGRFTAGFSVACSDGWFAKESVTVLAPDGQANVIASTEPLDPTIGSEDYARIQGDLLRTEFPRYVEHAFTPALVFGGRPGFVRRFSWTPPDGVSVTQIQLYHAQGGRGFTATATTPSTQFERHEPALRRILASLAYPS